jgi:hypothetical protein
MLSHAEIYGNIQTPVLKVEEGAKFQGSCEMRKDNTQTKSISYIDAKEKEPEIDSTAIDSIEMKEILKGKRRAKSDVTAKVLVD